MHMRVHTHTLKIHTRTHMGIAALVFPRLTHCGSAADMVAGGWVLAQDTVDNTEHRSFAVRFPTTAAVRTCGGVIALSHTNTYTHTHPLLFATMPLMAPSPPSPLFVQLFGLNQDQFDSLSHDDTNPDGPPYRTFFDTAGRLSNALIAARKYATEGPHAQRRAGQVCVCALAKLYLWCPCVPLTPCGRVPV